MQIFNSSAMVCTARERWLTRNETNFCEQYCLVDIVQNKRTRGDPSFIKLFFYSFFFSRTQMQTQIWQVRTHIDNLLMILLLFFFLARFSPTEKIVLETQFSVCFFLFGRFFSCSKLLDSIQFIVRRVFSIFLCVGEPSPHQFTSFK